jgi:hypothetical protein
MVEEASSKSAGGTRDKLCGCVGHGRPAYPRSRPIGDAFATRATATCAAAVLSALTVRAVSGTPGTLAGRRSRCRRRFRHGAHGPTTAVAPSDGHADTGGQCFDTTTADVYIAGTTGCWLFFYGKSGVRFICAFLWYVGLRSSYV